MDRDELVQGFIKEILGLLLRVDFPDELYSKKRKTYFMKTHRKSRHGMVANKEIAAFAISHLIRIRKIESEEKLLEILSLPFFSKYVRNAEPHKQNLRETQSSRPDIDLSDIGELERRQKLYEWALRKAKEAADEQYETYRSTKEIEFEEMIEQKQVEYTSLPSVLDVPEAEEPNVPDSAMDREDQYLPWWKRLHMLGDPFPTLEGLSQIPEEIYGSVLHRTDLFRRYEYSIEEVTEEVLKNTIVFGEFGSGKTTFFEYLIKALWSRDVPAIYLQLFTEEKVDLVMKRFKHELCQELRAMLENLLDEGFQVPELSDVEDEIVAILRAYWESKSPPGLVVFIDDLHKNTTYTQVSLDFLSFLQTFTANMNRAVEGLRICFFVAGALEWYPIVSREPQYSGSFPNRELIEDISVDDAHTMLNLRLRPFWPNPELRREVKREFVEREYKFLMEHGVPLTYRSFINRVREKFKVGEFDVLTSDPVTFGYDTLKGIQDILEADSKLKAKFDRLFKKVRKKWNRKNALEQLIHVFLMRGIEDDDSLIEQHHYHYQQLKSAQLIVKQKKRSGGFVWVACPELIRRNRLATRKYQISLESYLVPLYGLTIRKRTSIDEEVNLINSLIESYENEEIKRRLDVVKELHQRIVSEQRAFKSGLSAAQLVDLCVESLRTFSQVYFTHMDPIELILDPIKQWARYWFFPSETQQFLKLIEFEDMHEKRIWAIINMYRQTFASLLSFIVKQTEISGNFPVASLDLTKTESQRLRSLETDWIRSKFNRCAKKLHKLMQQQLSIHLHNLFVLFYGDFDNRIVHLPSRIRKKILKSLEGKIRQKHINEFRGLTLKDFSCIITGEDVAVSDDNWFNAFSKRVNSLRDDETSDILHEIERLPALHIDHGYSAEKLKNLIWKSITLLQDINRSYIYLATEGVTVETWGDELSLFIGFDSKLTGDPRPVKIDSLLLQKVKGNLMSNLLPLDDPRFIEATCDCTYREFIAFLGLGIKGLVQRAFGEPWKLIVSQIRGPNLAVRVEDVLESKPELVTEQLTQKLEALAPGHDEWQKYEELGIAILNYLFTPSFIIPPAIQAYTKDLREKRDAIYRISASGSPIWEQIRHDFNTFFVVVEFKNLTGQPDKDDVQQLGNYLLEIGRRMVGILCSRKPAGDSAFARRAKLWKTEKKLIMLLSDNDLMSMLKMKAGDQDPSEFIMNRISTFLRDLEA